MDAKELRLGNFVKFPAIQKEIVVNIRVIQDLSYGTTRYEPIELNEQWLEKFEFIFSRIQQRHLLKVDFELWICYSDEEGYTLQNVNQIVARFKAMKYVHELQNLYFVLTNKELNQINE